MSIHQIQVRYDPAQDRLLLQVLTQDRQLLPMWLTRRLAMRLMPHLRRTTAAAAVAGASPRATVLPDAQQMLAQASREKALKSADLQTPFDAGEARRPLGDEPMLPVSIDLSTPVGSGLAMTFRSEAGQSVEIKLGRDHALVMVELIESALAKSEWGIAADSAPTGPPAAGPTLLN